MENESSWKSSQLPFYVVIQDKSQGRLRDNNHRDDGDDNNREMSKFTSIEYDKILGNSVENSELFEAPINVYPEIRYKFVDDLEDIKNGSPAEHGAGHHHHHHHPVGQEGLNNDDTVVVLDFDHRGENIVGSRCLSDNWQVYEISRMKNNKVSFEGPNNHENTTNIVIKGTNSTIDLDSEAPIAGTVKVPKKVTGEEEDLDQSIEDIRNLVSLFNERNKQLEQMVNLHSTFPR
ncbi:hypothetical protein DASC09_032510 [Saccharomycopsis crataegensis]|uniref:Uncharacterized protein n=1 Tax=Saccharomycopsis crataegensis TaxID=43959 RepID=A0AAV5QMX1_9ASCO|nr:hypothetical protein DASC09_032510 [Saccharomycopsis crataegensis]